MSARNIILCGFMGTGKTTIGKIVAARLSWAFVDTDQVIEKRQGRPVAAIFAEQGEAAFRQLERDLCEEMAAEWRHHVVATGGGMVVNPANRAALMRAGLLVCLDATPEQLAARLASKNDRPLLANLTGEALTARIAELMASRAEAYSSIPYRVNTGNLSPFGAAEAILALWRRV
jgi:shikimate kinase